MIRNHHPVNEIYYDTWRHKRQEKGGTQQSVLPIQNMAVNGGNQLPSRSVSWSLAVSGWESNEEMEGTIVSFDGECTYYWTCDIEKYLDEQEIEWEVSA